ncbi:hypothetical protein [Mesorhizobium sp. M0244]|uniref:hypothetical protein n=1 Tax=Mesorhizobium sp. M0244 TaxID=2956926 RepID=UPI003335B255
MIHAGHDKLTLERRELLVNSISFLGWNVACHERQGLGRRVEQRDARGSSGPSMACAAAEIREKSSFVARLSFAPPYGGRWDSIDNNDKFDFRL